MRTYIVKYQAATYVGTRTVEAESEGEAIEKVKRWVHKEMTLPMYSESYKILHWEDIDQEELYNSGHY
jgi:hypothetical protein